MELIHHMPTSLDQVAHLITPHRTLGCLTAACRMAEVAISLIQARVERTSHLVTIRWQPRCTQRNNVGLKLPAVTATQDLAAMSRSFMACSRVRILAAIMVVLTSNTTCRKVTKATCKTPTPQ